MRVPPHKLFLFSVLVESLYAEPSGLKMSWVVFKIKLCCVNSVGDARSYDSMQQRLADLATEAEYFDREIR